MTAGEPFDIAPWGIGATGWDPERIARRESVLALSNGHLGWRGSLDEGDPCKVPGAYLNGVYEQHPMPYAEDGYGYPETGETVINVPDGKVIRLLVDDEPFDIRTGTLHEQAQFLDFAAGVLRREVRWTSPTGRGVTVRSTRLISLTHRSLAAIEYEVEATDVDVDVTLLSEIVANEPLPEVHPDERVKKALERPLVPVERFVSGDRATLLHRTRRSGISVAVGMDHVVEGRATVATEAADDVARTTVRARLGRGDGIRIVKYVAHESADALEDATLRDRVEAALAAARELGWEGLVREQRAYLDRFWAHADVRLDGSPRLQQAVRFALFQVLQSAARAEGRPIPGKGLTGPGYEGHTFWDSEAFVLPVLTYTVPDAARDVLRWRHSVLDHARERAAQLHLAGAAFPWRTISGRECSGYWPAGTVAFHINADIAAAVVRYVGATGDTDFERDHGLELLVETARLWVALGRWGADGSFHIDGVTGPDEYSALVDDNVFTNLSAQRNLEAAAAVARRHPDHARRLGVGADETAEWTRAAAAMTIPYDHERQVHQQSAGFTERERWDFEGTDAAQYPLQDHFPYFDLYRKQVVKQADLVLALQVAHEAFTPEQTARAFAYYEELTVRDSSLSAPAQAVVAARVGHVDLAMDYLTEAATVDLADLRDDVDDGLHIAALAGVWTALTAGFGGMRETADGLQFTPRLAHPLTGLAFGVCLEGRTLRVEVTEEATTYAIDAGPALRIRHFDEDVALEPGTPVRLETPPLADPGPPPRQPKGRSPHELLAAADGDHEEH